MRTLYFDCFAGASGDMIIGALIDVGLDFQELEQQLSKLDLSGYQIARERVKRSGIAAIKFNVKVEDAAQPARTLSDIREIINRSSLDEAVKARSIQIFERLAEAEARVHASTIDRIHFHEVGAVDSIIDIVGAAIGFESLGIKKFLASPLRVGRGSVEAAHGRLPVPAPGTAELLRGVPVYAGETEGEFVTPTGAAILTTLCESFAPLPAFTIERAGYGAGARDPKGFPNALRIILGETSEVEQQADRDFSTQLEAASPAPERVIVIETNIDDMNPQAYGFVMERAFALGALDFFITPVQMKKDRPAVMLTLLCERAKLDVMIDLLLAETTTLGVRYYEAQRRVLARAIEMVDTDYGRVRVKVALDGDRALHFNPEYEDCARLAEQARVPLIEVQTAAIAAYSAARKISEAEKKESSN